MAYQINDDEEYAMSGLSHVARLVYLYLRHHMDYETGITGIKRKVSLQSISEYLYVEPHQGIKEEKYTHKQVRCALNWLEKAGLIERNKASNKTNRQSIFKLILATRDNSVQNKEGRGRADKEGRGRADLQANKRNASNALDIINVGNSECLKVGMPPVSDIKTITSTRDPRQKFSMHLDWMPDPKKLKALQLNAGIPHIKISIDYIQEFRGFWSGRIDLEKTDHEWTHVLVSKFKQNMNYMRGKEYANNRHPSTSRQGKESLIERVTEGLQEWVESGY